MCLYVASHIQEIEGLSFEQCQALVRELIDFATQPEFVYQHHWAVGDQVIRDNLATMHRARPFDDAHVRRDLSSVRVLETPATEPQDVC